LRSQHRPIFVLLEWWHALDGVGRSIRITHRLPAGVVGPFETTQLANAWIESWRDRGYEPKGLPVARWGWLSLMTPEGANEWAAEVEAKNKKGKAG
jgi:hypothetical protein